MTRLALICTLGKDVEALRLKLRGKHLAYLAKHRDAILMGGPTVGEDGKPERMIILMQMPDLAAGHAFVANEPYSAAGVFSTVEVRAWNQVLPEATPGAFDRALNAELAANADSE